MPGGRNSGAVYNLYKVRLHVPLSILLHPFYYADPPRVFSKIRRASGTYLPGSSMLFWPIDITDLYLFFCFQSL